MKKKVTRRLIDLTKEGYDRIAEEFTGSRSYIWPVMKYLQKYVEQGSRILDVGCGNGRLFELFKNGNYEYTGMDISPEIIRLAKKKWLKEGEVPDFVISDVTTEIPFRDHRFDVVFMIAVLNHIPSEKQRIRALKNIYRVLSPRGLLLMTNFNLWKFSTFQKGLLKYTIKKIKIQDEEWERRFGFKKRDLGLRDVITEWKGGKKKAYLYYHAFSKLEMRCLAKKTHYRVLENFYENNGKKVPVYEGKNLVTVFQKY